MPQRSLLSSAQYAAVNGRETLDRGQIAIQRDARKNRMYQRPETRAGRPVRRARQLDDFHRRELQVRRLSPAVFAVCVTVRTKTESLLPASIACWRRARHEL